MADLVCTSTSTRRNLAEVGLSQPPFATLQIVSGAPNGPATLQSPFVPLVLPTSSYPIFMPRTRLDSVHPGNRSQRAGRQDQEYNLNVQYALGQDYLLQVGYVGTRSLHRPGQIEFDQALLGQPAEPDERRDDELGQQCDRSACPFRV